MITQKLLKEIISYDSESGIVTWLCRDEKHFKTSRDFNAWNSRFSGKVAGSYNHNGYMRIRIFDREHSLHRIAWVYTYGYISEDEIDHINGIRDDNRIENLRCVSKKENAMNQKKPSSNNSGCVGVSWSHRSRRWRSYITNNTKQVYLGLFDDWFEAVCARKSAEKRYGFHENHGRKL